VTSPHYYDGKGEIAFEKIEKEGVFLPVKFGWDMNVRGWNATTLDSGAPRSLKVTVSNAFTKFLTEDELLDLNRNRNLEDLRIKAANSDEDFKKFLNYLNGFSKDPLVTFLLANKVERDKFRQDLQFWQRIDQLIYFVYFRERTSKLFTYSPSEDKSVGPCKLKPNTNYSWKVKACCSTNQNNCGPPNLEEIRDPKKWKFKTLNAPEPLAVLDLKIEKWNEMWDEEKQAWLKKEFIATSTRWIDTDWNGPNYPTLKGDFVDFEFCPSPTFDKLRSFYQARVEIGEEYPEEEKVEKGETSVAKCLDPSTPCLCQEEPCKCDTCIEKFVDNIDICHPLLWVSSEISRLRWPADVLAEGEAKAREKIQKEMNNNCWTHPTFLAFGPPGKLAEVEKINLNYWDSYYPLLQSVDPNNLWKWDILYSGFFNSKQRVGWEGGGPGLNTESEGLLYSQRWHFKTNALPLKMEIEKITDLERWILFLPDKIEKIGVYPEAIQNYTGSTLTINRLQQLLYNTLGRVLSYRIKIFDDKNQEIPIPKVFSLIRRRVGAYQQLTSPLRVFTFGEIWSCLEKFGKEQGIENYPINQKLKVKIIPCWDELGENCQSSLTYSSTILVTGAAPTGLNPAPPETVKIPRYLEWDDVPGAASYLYEINGQKGLAIQNSQAWVDLKEDGQYIWKVRTCADVCDKIDAEDWIQCGKESEEKTFYGCLLVPPLNALPINGEEFLPDETVSLSWDSIACSQFYQYKLSYAGPFIYEKRAECQPKEIIPATTVTTTNVTLSTSSVACYGIYRWQIRGCIDEKCQQAGDWSGIWYFQIVKEKSPKGREVGGGGGIGKCRNLIPCRSGECQLKHLVILIGNIINCILWTLAPIGLVMLALYTGIIFYFSFGAIETLARVKSIWRSALMGLALMFLAWTILNFIFTFLGYKKSFGDWWNPT